MITHDEILNAICKKYSVETQTLIIDYVKQQEMKDKLLELYREFGKQVDEFSEFAFSIYDEIQALEEEMK